MSFSEELVTDLLLEAMHLTQEKSKKQKFDFLIEAAKLNIYPTKETINHWIEMTLPNWFLSELNYFKIIMKPLHLEIYLSQVFEISLKNLILSTTISSLTFKLRHSIPIKDRDFINDWLRTKKINNFILAQFVWDDPRSMHEDIFLWVLNQKPNVNWVNLISILIPLNINKRLYEVNLNIIKHLFPFIFQNLNLPEEFSDYFNSKIA